MALLRFRRISFITHGMRGWWWASRHNYPGDEHGVRIPIYGWVDAETAEPVPGSLAPSAPAVTASTAPSVSAGAMSAFAKDPFETLLIDA